MSQRLYDVIVLGASGFTGVQVCLHIARSLPALKWAVAGRSKGRLQVQVADRLSAEGLPQPQGVLVVDNADEAGLRATLQTSRLCLNCTGPYRFLGETVVAAAIDVGCDYMDLCGEPEFISRMKLKYHLKAQEKRVAVLHACAFDSVPACLGTLFTAQQFKQKGGICSSVASYLTIHTGPDGLCGHATTYEAAVHGFGAVQDLRRIRKELKAAFPPAVVPRAGPKPPAKEGPFYEPAEAVAATAFKFPGADAAIVRMTQEALAEREGALGLCPHFSAYFTVPSKWAASMVMLYGAAFTALSGSEWGRRTLLKYPGLFTKGTFTHEGPTAKQLAETSFTMTLLGEGYSAVAAAALPLDSESGGGATAAAGSTGSPATAAAAAAAAAPAPDLKIVCRVSGPEPGYVATPLIFLAVASTLLEERDSLPCAGGGVFSPGAALWGSSVLDRLRAAGIGFDVVSSSDAEQAAGATADTAV